uniref:uncharacterized protein n=1 Tax=Pristiophorus japonicus TaxID=55135 RepID=UPI00398F3ADC
MMATPRTPTGGGRTSQPAPTPTVPTAAHSKIPDALQTFRSSEPKALGVALIMLGIILGVTAVPLVKSLTPVVTGTGAPLYAAVLLSISGSLAIVSEKNPRRVLLKVCLACTVLSAMVTGVQLIIYLVDLNNYKMGIFHCSSSQYDKKCFDIAMQQRTLFRFVPAFYLLTLFGMMLCIILSINLCDVIHSWNPELDQPVATVMSTPSDAEGAALISGEQGNVPMEEPQPIPAPGPRDHRPTKPVGSGKSSLLVQKFLEGQPKMLGVVHIVLALGLIIVTMPSLVMHFDEEISLGLLWWIVLQCIGSGVLSIAAEERPTINMIRACMALNIISAIATTIGILIFVGTIIDTGYCLHIECQVGIC